MFSQSTDLEIYNVGYIDSPANLTCWHEIDDQSWVSNVTAPWLAPTDWHTDLRVSTANSVWRRRKETQLKCTPYKGVRKYTLELYWSTESIKKKHLRKKTMQWISPLIKKGVHNRNLTRISHWKCIFLIIHAILWISFYKQCERILITEINSL